MTKKAKRKRVNYRNDELLKAIGERIRAIRKSQELSLEKFANESGIDYSQISRMELGKVNVTVSMLDKVAKELNVSLQELLP